MLPQALVRPGGRRRNGALLAKYRSVRVMTATRIHSEHAAGASKPQQASSPSFGSVLANAAIEGRTTRTATAPVQGDSSAESKSPTGRQPIPSNPEHAPAAPAAQQSAGSQEHSHAAQSGSSEASSGRL